jgi:hypothetical protein
MPGWIVAVRGAVPRMIGDPLSTLVERAAGKPIYVTARLGLNRQWLDALLDLWRRTHPNAELVASWRLYSGLADWLTRWPRECERYGALVVITHDPAPFEAYGRALDEWEARKPIIPKGSHRGNPELKEWRRREPKHWDFCRGTGASENHIIGAGVARELRDADRLGWPIHWTPLEGSICGSQPRFAVEALEWFNRRSFARLVPAVDAEPLRPIIGPLPFLVIGDAAPRPHLTVVREK